MNFEATFPVRYWINLGRRADRRGEVEWMFERAGVRAERFPAVDARFVGRMALERGKKAAEAEGVREVGGRRFAAEETGGMPTPDLVKGSAADSARCPQCRPASSGSVKNCTRADPPFTVPPLADVVGPHLSVCRWK